MLVTLSNLLQVILLPGVVVSIHCMILGMSTFFCIDGNQGRDELYYLLEKKFIFLNHDGVG